MPEQNPDMIESIFKNFLNDNCPFKLKIKTETKVKPVTIPTNNIFIKAASDAYKRKDSEIHLFI